MFIDNRTTPPGNLNPRHPQEHIDQRPRHHASSGEGRPAPGGVNPHLIASPE